MSSQRRSLTVALLQCSYCPRTYHFPSDLKRHEMTHTGEKSHECAVCGFGSIMMTGIVKHVEKWHPREAEIMVAKFGRFIAKKSDPQLLLARDLFRLGKRTDSHHLSFAKKTDSPQLFFAKKTDSPHLSFAKKADSPHLPFAKKTVSPHLPFAKDLFGLGKSRLKKEWKEEVGSCWNRVDGAFGGREKSSVRAEVPDGRRIRDYFDSPEYFQDVFNNNVVSKEGAVNAVKAEASGESSVLIFKDDGTFDVLDDEAEDDSNAMEYERTKVKGFASDVRATPSSQVSNGTPRISVIDTAFISSASLPPPLFGAPPCFDLTRRDVGPLCDDHSLAGFFAWPASQLLCAEALGVTSHSTSSFSLIKSGNESFGASLNAGVIGESSL